MSEYLRVASLLKVLILMCCPSLHLLRTPSNVRATAVCRIGDITPVLQKEPELISE